MKNYIKNLFVGLLFGICGALVFFIWTDATCFNINRVEMALYAKILSTIAIGGCCVVLSLTITSFDTKKPLNTKGIMYTELFNLDPEEDVYCIRRVKSMMNNKLNYSRTNKLMIKAKKDICGKNCKCTQIKKSQGCIDCGVFNEYVEYLKEYTKE
jgi:hypothetical protein